MNLLTLLQGLIENSKQEAVATASELENLTFRSLHQKLSLQGLPVTMRRSYGEMPEEMARRGLMKSETRTDMQLLMQIYSKGLGDEERERAFEKAIASYPGKAREKTWLRILWARSKGDNAFSAGKHVKAIEHYNEALHTLFDGEARYLQPEFYNSEYLAHFAPADSWRLQMDLVTAAATISQCYTELKDFCKVSLFRVF